MQSRAERSSSSKMFAFVLLLLFFVDALASGYGLYACFAVGNWPFVSALLGMLLETWFLCVTRDDEQGMCGGETDEALATAGRDRMYRIYSYLSWIYYAMTVVSIALGTGLYAEQVELPQACSQPRLQTWTILQLFALLAIGMRYTVRAAQMSHNCA